MYFNEHEPYVAAWLRNLWPGAAVDERSIVEVQPAELVGHRRVHLFAGIGGWEYALRLAGWPEGREVWTGSCPCQPFSSAGRNDGVLDERHLWPTFHRLIAERHPSIIFGEQVASAAGRAWLAGVRTDLEGLGYAVGAADLCAASVGAPHIRQRLYWVAESAGSRWSARPGRDGETDGWPSPEPRRLRDARGLADARSERRRQERGGPPGGFWDTYDLLPCRDGKARRVEPGSFPLAHGVPGRVGRLRAYGNAIIPQVAASFVRAYLESEAS